MFNLRIERLFLVAGVVIVCCECTILEYVNVCLSSEREYSFLAVAFVI